MDSNDLIIPADKTKLRALVDELDLDPWVWREVGKTRTRRLLAYAKRRMLETGDSSLRCLEAEVLAVIYPKAPDPVRFVCWKLSYKTQLRQVLNAMITDALAKHGLDQDYLAGKLKAQIEGAETEGQLSAMLNGLKLLNDMLAEEQGSLDNDYLISEAKYEELLSGATYEDDPIG